MECSHSAAALRVGALAFAVVACGSGAKSSQGESAMQKPPVLLECSIENPALSINSSGTEPRIDGTFDLVLSLGADASAATTGAVAGFQAMNAANMSTSVPVLHTMTTSQPPFGVMPGETVHVPITLQGSRFDNPADRDRVCAGPQIIWGAISDSLNKVEVGAFSPAFTATSCP